MGTWHRMWQGLFPPAWREHRIRDAEGELHIADVMTPSGIVLEFQASPISAAEKSAREQAHERMIWIVRIDAPITMDPAPSWHYRPVPVYLHRPSNIEKLYYLDPRERGIDFNNTTTVDAFVRAITAVHFPWEPPVAPPARSPLYASELAALTARSPIHGLHRTPPPATSTLYASELAAKKRRHR